MPATTVIRAPTRPPSVISVGVMVQAEDTGLMYLGDGITAGGLPFIDIGIIDGDRLPDMSETKKGGVPPTGTPSGKVLSDGSTWIEAGAGGGLTQAQVLARGLGA